MTRPVSKPFPQPSRRRGTCVCPASHCYRQRPTEAFIIAFFFSSGQPVPLVTAAVSMMWNYPKRLLSIQCSQTSHSVGLITACVSHVRKQSPQGLISRKSPRVREEIRICPTSLLLHPKPPCSTLFQPPLGPGAPPQLLARPTPQLAPGPGPLSWTQLAAPNPTGTARIPAQHPALCLGLWNVGEASNSCSLNLSAGWRSTTWARGSAEAPGPLRAVPLQSVSGTLRLRRGTTEPVEPLLLVQLSVKIFTLSSM